MIKELIFQKKVVSLGDFSAAAEELKIHMTKRTCILLSGDLAAGKTTFVQSYCELVGLSATSPTFSLHHSYQNENHRVDHFDLYRLSTEDEIETSGLWDTFSQLTGLIFIEWPERINSHDLPLTWKLIKIEIEKLEQDTRLISAYLLH